MDQFQVLELIAEGSFSQIFKVRRIEDKQIYVMKQIDLKILSPKDIQNALNEVRILSSINSSYILSYKQTFYNKKKNLICLITEYIEGGDLGQQITQPLPESEIWKALIHLTLGLQQIHQLGVLHRDIKIANLFKDSKGNYKIGDLNVSKLSLLAQTQTGTPYCAAPEIWRNQRYSTPADYWSLGCILYYMATLRTPFIAHDLQSLYRKIQAGFYEPLPSTYSKNLSQIIGQLLKVPTALRAKYENIIQIPYIHENFGKIIRQQKLIKQQTLFKTIRYSRDLGLEGNEFPNNNFNDNVKLNNYVSLDEQSQNQNDESHIIQHIIRRIRIEPKSTKRNNIIIKKDDVNKSVNDGIEQKNPHSPFIIRRPRVIRNKSLHQ